MPLHQSPLHTQQYTKPGTVHIMHMAPFEGGKSETGENSLFYDHIKFIESIWIGEWYSIFRNGILLLESAHAIRNREQQCPHLSFGGIWTFAGWLKPRKLHNNPTKSDCTQFYWVLCHWKVVVQRCKTVQLHKWSMHSILVRLFDTVRQSPLEFALILCGV